MAIHGMKQQLCCCFTKGKDHRWNLVMDPTAKEMQTNKKNIKYIILLLLLSIIPKMKLKESTGSDSILDQTQISVNLRFGH